MGQFSQMEVVQHYGNLTDSKFTLADRAQSKIVCMRNYNNWLKGVLLGKVVRSGHSVLDLCCGKGGDLPKFANLSIGKYTGVDITRQSVIDAANRYNAHRGIRFPGSFYVADCFSVPLSEHFPADLRFDAVSCQFAMHYAFDSEERVRQMLRNITGRLVEGGFFVGTAADSNRLVAKARKLSQSTFGNSVYSVEFDSIDNFEVYGTRYFFTLCDGSVHHVPEFLVHFPTFESIAKEYNLHLVENKNFQQFYVDNIHEGRNKEVFLRRNLPCVNASGTISDDEWEAIGLYQCFTFQLRGSGNGTGNVSGGRGSGTGKVSLQVPEAIVDLSV
jgi:mRNA (guanine-N7-)-methyltransferase